LFYENQRKGGGKSSEVTVTCERWQNVVKT